jgi:uncharacterized phage-like protein YoqJ
MIVAGTGHRWAKLGYYSHSLENDLTYLAEQALKVLKPDKIISGLALGWDSSLALAAIRLNIPFIGAVPFKGQESRWPKYHQEKYAELLSRAESVQIVSGGGYSAKKMQLRNEWMVNNSDALLALYDGSGGGTYNCIKYAEMENLRAVSKKHPKPIYNVWDAWQILCGLKKHESRAMFYLTLEQCLGEC